MKKQHDAIQHNDPAEPTRVSSFARFFKNYMSISAVVAAALPIPVASFKLIPTFSCQTSSLSTYASLFCFLLLGFIFYIRHPLARLMFPELLAGVTYASRGGPLQRTIPWIPRSWLRFAITFLPAFLIALSLSCVLLYHGELNESLSVIITGRDSSAPFDEVAIKNGRKTKDVLETTDEWQIPGSTLLMAYYFGIFISAESAFILMALKEYLQDLVKLSEMDLIVAQPNSFSSEREPAKSGEIEQLEGVLRPQTETQEYKLSKAIGLSSVTVSMIFSAWCVWMYREDKTTRIEMISLGRRMTELEQVASGTSKTFKRPISPVLQNTGKPYDTHGKIASPEPSTTPPEPKEAN